MKKTGVLAAGTIWFGAAVSIAEIEAGCRIGGNWTALLLGHLLGGLLLFATGLIGARTKLNAMETTQGSFGRHGIRLFAVLNVLQLVGWTAVMIAQGAAALGCLTEAPPGGWCVVLALLVVLWMFVGRGGVSRFGTICMLLLAALCAVLTVRLLGAGGSTGSSESATGPGFWPAFEISIALPLSWLPLISDYTKEADRPVAVAAASAGTYTVVSLWMFSLGILLVGSGSPDLVRGVVRQGHGFAGIGFLVILLSSVITTYFDVNSSGESLRAVFKGVRPKAVGIVVAAVGAALAAGGIMDLYVGFLELIASVFAPMAAVLLVDRYLVRRGLAGWNLLAWFLGFVVYHALIFLDFRSTPAALAVSASIALLRRWK